MTLRNTVRSSPLIGVEDRFSATACTSRIMLTGPNSGFHWVTDAAK